VANHFRTDEQQESSLDDRFGVISQDDLSQLDQQDVATDQVETQDFSADVPVAQAAEPVTTESDPFASGVEPVHVVTAEQQNNPEQAPLDRAKFFADLAQNAPQVERTGTPTISFKDATLVYPSQPNRPALDNISTDIYPGEFVFVVGHSGSGKSSLLRLITREQKATHGQVIVAGQDLTRMRNSKVPYLRRQIGTVFQDFKLLPDKTVYENVSFALECIGKPRSVINVQVPEVLRLKMKGSAVLAKNLRALSALGPCSTELARQALEQANNTNPA